MAQCNDHPHPHPHPHRRHHHHHHYHGCHKQLYSRFKGHDANPVFKKLSGLGDESEREEDPEAAEEEPPASILVRRQALVPPKLITDDYESANEDIDTGLSGSGGSTGRGSDSLDASGQLGDVGIDGDGGRSSRGSNPPGSTSPGANRLSPNL